MKESFLTSFFFLLPLIGVCASKPLSFAWMYWEQIFVLCKYSPQNITNFPFTHFRKSFFSVMWIFEFIENHRFCFFEKIRIKDLSFLVISRTLKKRWFSWKNWRFELVIYDRLFEFFIKKLRTVITYTIIRHLSSWEPWLWILRTAALITAKESGVCSRF